MTTPTTRPFIDRTTPPRPDNWQPEEVAGLILLILFCVLIGFALGLVTWLVWSVLL